jgi:hypothetical protein
VTPPLLGFVAHEAEDRLKDTVRNILESEEYVINTVTESMAVQVKVCSEIFPPSVSEAAEVGFHALPSNFMRAGCIAESSVNFECRLCRLGPFLDLNAVPRASLIRATPGGGRNPRSSAGRGSAVGHQLKPGHQRIRCGPSTFPGCR